MESISMDVWTPAFNMRDLSGHNSKYSGSDKELPMGSTEHVPTGSTSFWPFYLYVDFVNISLSICRATLSLDRLLMQHYTRLNTQNVKINVPIEWPDWSATGGNMLSRARRRFFVGSSRFGIMAAEISHVESRRPNVR